MDVEKINTILATDCGSTTTKAILIEKKDGQFRLTSRGEAPTTVEAPVEDVTKGVINSIREIQELSKRTILENDDLIKPSYNNKGIDIYISTSSAGGGLQMMVAGVVRSMSVESAQRAALGAGAIVIDSIAINDKKPVYQEIEKIRKYRPDMILLSGGVEGGTLKHVLKQAQLISAADPKARLGATYKLPVIFAGNKDAHNDIKDILENKTALRITDNLRPTLETENLMPARFEIQTLFLEHVMQHAPGYKKLLELTDAPIMPTPAAVGNIMQTIAAKENIQILGVDIGGATTDVFSVFEGIFNRTVSANYGMSYSISNVLSDAGLENITRWIPFEINEKDLRNRIKNKMIRPTTIPQTLEDLILEQAVAREALRMSLEQHRSLAVGLKGKQKQRTISDAFDQSSSGETLVNMMNLDMIIGSGGVLSHAPRRIQSALMMTDAFMPEGITLLTVDSIFMMPQLGVLAEAHPEAALSVFEKDCLIYLGTCIAPAGNIKDSIHALKANIKTEKKEEEIEIPYGSIINYPLGCDEYADVLLKPVKGLDLGEGSGKPVSKKVRGGVSGIIFDLRGRPIEIPADNEKRISKLTKWYNDLNIYPERKH